MQYIVPPSVPKIKDLVYAFPRILEIVQIICKEVLGFDWLYVIKIPNRMAYYAEPLNPGGDSWPVCHEHRSVFFSPFLGIVYAGLNNT